MGKAVSRMLVVSGLYIPPLGLPRLQVGTLPRLWAVTCMGPVIQGSGAALAPCRVGKEQGWARQDQEQGCQGGWGTVRQVVPVWSHVCHSSECIHALGERHPWAEGHPQADWHEGEKSMPRIMRCPGAGMRKLRHG